MVRALAWLGSWCATLLMSPALVAGEEESAVDGDFLEFLGSWGGEDEAWAEFLAAMEIRRAEKPREQEQPQSKQVDP